MLNSSETSNLPPRPSPGFGVDVTPEQLRAITDALPAMIAYIDTSETVRFANPALESWFGISEGGMRGRSVRSILGDTIYPPAKSYLSRALCGETLRYQVPVCRDGVERFLEGQFLPDLDNEGRIRGAVVISTDCTARRQSERAQEAATVSLLASQAQLAAILEGVADGITVQSPNGRMIFANDAAARIMRVESAAALVAADPFLMFNDYEVRTESGELLPFDQLPSRRVLRGESVPRETVMRIRHLKTGIERWSAVRVTALRDANGALECVVNIFSDITERVRREQTLRFLDQASRVLSSSLEYQTTLQQVARLAVEQLGGWCGVRLLGPDGRLNELAVEHFDPSRVQLARQIYELYPPDPATDRGEYLALRSCQSVFHPMIPHALIVESARDTRHLELIEELGLQSYICTPILADGSPLGVISFASGERFYDEHDLKAAEELAKRASLAIQNARLYQRAKEAVDTRDLFLSIASHELRTPITSMKLQTQQMARSIERGEQRAFEPQRVQKMVEQSSRSIDRLTRLIEDMLDISRLQIGRLGLQPEQVNLSDIVREVLDRFSPQMAAAGMTVETDFAAEPIGVWDRDRLDQVVTNLVTNAIRYAPESHLTLRLYKEQDRAILQVCDTGPGIAPENHERIFQRFERLVNASEVSGLGLGLYIVREFLHAQGGTIRVESEPGRGSTFTVELPLLPVSI